MESFQGLAYHPNPLSLDRRQNLALDPGGTEPRKSGRLGSYERVENIRAPHSRREVVLDAAQARALVAAAYEINGFVGDFIALSFDTGSRYGELASAHVRDVNREGAVLRLSGKTGSRTIAVAGRAATILARLSRGRDGDDILLKQRNGRPFGEGSLRHPLAKAVAAAGLDEKAVGGQISIYAARHSFITSALYSGVPIAGIARHCGTSVGMIESTYSHVIAGLETDNAVRFAKLFDDGANERDHSHSDKGEIDRLKAENQILRDENARVYEEVARADGEAAAAWWDKGTAEIARRRHHATGNNAKAAQAESERQEFDRRVSGIIADWPRRVSIKEVLRDDAFAEVSGTLASQERRVRESLQRLRTPYKGQRARNYRQLRGVVGQRHKSRS